VIRRGGGLHNREKPAGAREDRGLKKKEGAKVFFRKRGGKDGRGKGTKMLAKIYEGPANSKQSLVRTVEGLSKREGSKDNRMIFEGRASIPTCCCRNKAIQGVEPMRIVKKWETKGT